MNERAGRNGFSPELTGTNVLPHKCNWLVSQIRHSFTLANFPVKNSTSLSVATNSTCRSSAQLSSARHRSAWLDWPRERRGLFSGERKSARERKRTNFSRFISEFHKCVGSGRVASRRVVRRGRIFLLD